MCSPETRTSRLPDLRSQELAGGFQAINDYRTMLSAMEARNPPSDLADPMWQPFLSAYKGWRSSTRRLWHGPQPPYAELPWLAIHLSNRLVSARCNRVYSMSLCLRHLIVLSSYHSILGQRYIIQTSIVRHVLVVGWEGN